MNGNRLNLKLYHPNDITVRSEKTQRIRKCWYKYWNLQNVLSRLRDTPWMWQQHQSLQTLLPNAPSTGGTCRTNTTTRWLRPHRNKQKIKDEIRSSVTVDLTWLIVVASSPPRTCCCWASSSALTEGCSPRGSPACAPRSTTRWRSAWRWPTERVRGGRPLLCLVVVLYFNRKSRQHFNTGV